MLLYTTITKLLCLRALYCWILTTEKGNVLSDAHDWSPRYQQTNNRLSSVIRALSLAWSVGHSRHPSHIVMFALSICMLKTAFYYRAFGAVGASIAFAWFIIMTYCLLYCADRPTTKTDIKTCCRCGYVFASVKRTQRLWMPLPSIWICNLYREHLYRKI